MKITKEEFYKSVAIAGEDECWDWQGLKNQYGHGIVYVGSRFYNVSWMTWVLNYPTQSSKGKVVRRTCGNKLCANPAHLFLDEKVPTKLSSDDARVIRRMYRDKNKTLKELADFFEVSSPTIRAVLMNETWKHAQPEGPPVVYHGRDKK